jgi:hypothetical protein
MEQVIFYVELFLGFTQSLMKWVPGALSPRVKRPGREADHWPGSSADVKKAWSSTSTRPYVFMTWCLTGQETRFHGGQLQ